MAKKSKNSVNYKNKKMNGEVYKLRKNVMSFIYEAKKLTDLPRIDVRITENHDHILGSARMKDNIIWITSDTSQSDSDFLRVIVYHEILHAVYGVNHDDNCPLMNPAPKTMNKAKCNKLFKNYTKSNS